MYCMTHMSQAPRCANVAGLEVAPPGYSFLYGLPAMRCDQRGALQTVRWYAPERCPMSSGVAGPHPLTCRAVFHRCFSLTPPYGGAMSCHHSARGRVANRGLRPAAGHLHRRRERRVLRLSLAPTLNPSFRVVSPNTRHVYAVNEWPGDNGSASQRGGINAFRFVLFRFVSMQRAGR